MKKLLIAIGVLIVIFLGTAIYVFTSLKPADPMADPIVFKIESGTNKIEIVNHLKKSGLIRSKFATLVYVFMHPGLNLQAGNYEISASQSTDAIIEKIADGDIINVVQTVQITFVEGKTFEDYAKLLAKNFDIPEEDLKNKIKDKEYLKELINDYWFLDESILNDELYYSLEGYLAPDTYEFYKTADANQVIRKLLDQTGDRLEPYKDSIKASGYTVHEILALASIAEKEGNTYEDRTKISQVLFKRLELGKGLGCDVTTYYAVHKSLKEPLYYTDLETKSPYNTSERNKDMAGKIPVGPICNPGESSIKAILNPANTDFLYFVADVETGKIYFAKDYNEFLEYKNEYVK